MLFRLCQHERGQTKWTHDWLECPPSNKPSHGESLWGIAAFRDVTIPKRHSNQKGCLTNASSLGHWSQNHISVTTATVTTSTVTTFYVDKDKRQVSMYLCLPMVKNIQAYISHCIRHLCIYGRTHSIPLHSTLHRHCDHLCNDWLEWHCICPKGHYGQRRKHLQKLRKLWLDKQWRVFLCRVETFGFMVVYWLQYYYCCQITHL